MMNLKMIYHRGFNGKCYTVTPVTPFLRVRLCEKNFFRK